MLAHCAHHLLTALPTPLLPYIRNEFQLSYTSSSFVTSAFALASGAGQLPAGFLADRTGPKLLMMVGIIGVAGAGVLVGLSQTYLMLLILLVLMGLLSGGYHPAATPLISASVLPNQRGRALGFHLIGGTGSFFLAPIIAAAIADTWGWRGAFIGLAIPTVIFGLVFYIYLSRQKSRDHVETVTKNAVEEAPPPPGYVRRLAAFLIMSVLGGAVSMSTISFISLYAVDELGASERVAASLLSIVFFSGIWASPVGGYLSDRIGRVPIIVITSFISGITVYALQLPPLGMGFYTTLFIIGLNDSLRMPVSEAFIAGQTPAHRRSTIFGVYYFSTQYTGAVLAPVMGQLIDKLGFDTCFTIAGITVVSVVLVCSPFLRGSQD